MKSASTIHHQYLLLNMYTGLNNILGDIRGKPPDLSENKRNPNILLGDF